MKRANFEPEHQDFRETVGRFVTDEIMPNFEQWEEDAIVPRELFL